MIGVVRSAIQRITGTVESQRFDHPTWINVVYNENSKYHGIQSSQKAAAYRLKTDVLVVRRATVRMNESPFRRFPVEEIERAWVGSRPFFEWEMIVGDLPNPYIGESADSDGALVADVRREGDD